MINFEVVEQPKAPQNLPVTMSMSTDSSGDLCIHATQGTDSITILWVTKSGKAIAAWLDKNQREIAKCMGFRLGERGEEIMVVL